jgi:hypothetical protein
MVEQDGYVEMVSPVAPAPDRGEAGASRRQERAWSGFGGARVSIVDNGKANALELLEDLQRLLISRYAAVAGITVHKEVSGPIREAALADLVAGSDLVLVGSAD